MATKAQEAAVRNYLLSLKDPGKLKDEEQIASLRSKLESTDDDLERLQIRQKLLDLESPATEQYEDEFVTHAKAWADQQGVSDQAFLAEGVPGQVLRKAGFRNVRDGRRRGASTTARSRGRRRRVSADEVRASIPKGAFTIQQVQEASGASPAVVRRVVQEEVDASRVTEEGKDPGHRGPGRAPALYRR